jgi:uncharacterized protein involved in response to NO
VREPAGSREFRSRPFVWASLAAGLLPGFGGGVALVAGLLAGRPVSGWWPALVQAHGHAQLFGFAGLLIFGVGLHFLPRLRGAPLIAPHLVPLVLVLYGGGVLLRVAGQIAGPLFDAPGLAPTWPRTVCAAALALSGPLTLAGACLGIALLAGTGLSGPPLRTRPGVLQVLPLMAVSMAGLVLALVIDGAGAVAAGATALTLVADPPVAMATWAVPAAADTAAVQLAFLGWIVPVAVAFSARNYPLFVRTRLATATGLRGGLLLLVAGVALDLAGRAASGLPGVQALAGVLEGAALIWFTMVVGALGPKVQLPGRMSDPAEARLARLTASPLIGAYVWLAVAGTLLVLVALAPLAGWLPPPEDAPRHALGAGFVLLLIAGMALRLLPGFAGARPRVVRLGPAQTAIVAAHIAAVLRVLPPIVLWLLAAAGASAPPWLAAAANMALVLAGLAGAAFVVALALALWPVLWGPAWKGGR